MPSKAKSKPKKSGSKQGKPSSQKQLKAVSKTSKTDEHKHSKTDEKTKESKKKKSIDSGPRYPDGSAMNQGPVPEPRPVEEEEYYHGLLPRVDITKLLSAQGSWLVRRTTVNDDDRYVLSVGWDGAVCNIVIHHRENKRLMITKDKDFGNMHELVAYYRTGKKLSPQKECIMKKMIPRQKWELRHEQITLGKKLGEGAFGEVFRGTLALGDMPDVPCAVKRSNADRTLTKEEICEIVTEARIMQSLCHPNLVKLWGVAAETQPVMLALELVGNGGLDGYLQKNATSRTQKTGFCLDAARGMAYLHKQKMLHRDLACRNCLITEALVVKISDFGLSHEGTTYTMKPHTKVPIRWLAPETFTTLTYTLATDVWSFAVMMWEILHDGIEPYPGMSPPEVKAMVASGQTMDLENDPAIPFNMKTIMSVCWAMEPKCRPSLSMLRTRLEEAHQKELTADGKQAPPTGVESADLV